MVQHTPKFCVLYAEKYVTNIIISEDILSAFSNKAEAGLIIFGRSFAFLPPEKWKLWEILGCLNLIQLGDTSVLEFD